MASLFRSQLVRPSYKSGFARSAGESANPDLWPFGGWVPALGNNGSELHDVTGKNHGAFVSSTTPVWDVNTTAQGSSEVLNWDTETDDSGINLGDILDFRFLQFY